MEDRRAILNRSAHKVNRSCTANRLVASDDLSVVHDEFVISRLRIYSRATVVSGTIAYLAAVHNEAVLARRLHKYGSAAVVSGTARYRAGVHHKAVRSRRNIHGSAFDGGTVVDRAAVHKEAALA